MSMYWPWKKQGFSLIEALIVIAVSTLIFTALVSGIEYSLNLVANSSAKTSALSLANDRIEYFRSLPYDEIGTVAGIPEGIIPQNSTTTLNGINFSERVLVEYVDDPADGQLTATTTDSNGIPADYKRVKIEISWSLQGASDSISLISNIVPRSIESTDGGGTVRVNVLNADSTFLSGASVRLLNETTTSTIDVTRFTDSTGAALFSGAPAASNYQVFVTAPGYSTDQTYVSTTSNPNPITSPFSVLEADISTVTFQIGELSDIDITTLSDITTGEFAESFTDNLGTNVASSTNIEVTGGVVQLAQNAGVYYNQGTVFLNAKTPATLEKWGSLVVVANEDAFQTYTIRFYNGTNLIDDSDLAGNSSGFTNEAIIDLSGLDIGAFPSLTIGITLDTSNTSFTPAIDEAVLYYKEASTALANVNLSIRGNKTIGTELDASPIYKYSTTPVTDGAGTLSLTDIEFDTYTIENTDGYELAHACADVPLVHEAGIDSEVELVLTSAGANTLRTMVLNSEGVPIPGVDVTLSRTGFTDTITTDICGQAFFSSGVAAQSDYSLTATRAGYNTTTVDPYDLSGASKTTIVMSEI